MGADKKRKPLQALFYKGFPVFLCCIFSTIAYGLLLFITVFLHTPQMPETLINTMLRGSPLPSAVLHRIKYKRVKVGAKVGADMGANQKGRFPAP